MPELVKAVSLSISLPAPLTSRMAVLVSTPVWILSLPVRSSVPWLVTVPLLTVLPLSVSWAVASAWMVPPALAI